MMNFAALIRSSQSAPAPLEEEEATVEGAVRGVQRRRAGADSKDDAEGPRRHRGSRDGHAPLTSGCTVVQGLATNRQRAGVSCNRRQRGMVRIRGCMCLRARGC
jgi:hypothetical protein